MAADSKQGSPWGFSGTERKREEGFREPFKPSQIMLQQEMKQAADEFDRPASGLLVSGFSAGVSVGVSLLLMAIVTTLSDDRLPPILHELILANVFTVGFIIAILGRMDLFTEFTTIAILPVIAGDATLRALTRLWVLILLGNLVGAAAFAGLTASFGPALGIIQPTALTEIARNLVEHTWWVILLSSILAGWLMGVLSWLITGGRETISQIFFVWLITASIGFAHLHHSITGTAEVLAGMLVEPEITTSHFAYFLAWTTVGNALGGIVFAVSVPYSLHMRHREAPRGNASGGT